MDWLLVRLCPGFIGTESGLASSILKCLTIFRMYAVWENEIVLFSLSLWIPIPSNHHKLPISFMPYFKLRSLLNLCTALGEFLAMVMSSTSTVRIVAS